MKFLCRLVAVVLLTGCERNWVQYGREANLQQMQRTAVTVTNAVAQGVGEVTVEGELGVVCELGCWFYLLDDAEMIFVRREQGTGWTIQPDSSGLRAVDPQSHRG